MPVKPWPTAHPVPTSSSSFASSASRVAACAIEEGRQAVLLAICCQIYYVAGDRKKKKKKEKRKRPSKKAITNDVSFRAACLITSSSRRSKREAIRDGERGGRGERWTKASGGTRGERGKGEERVVHFLRSGPPFTIRSSSDKRKEGRTINTSVIISLQIFSDASTVRKCRLIASPVYHFFNNTFLMPSRPVLAVYPFNCRRLSTAIIRGTL